MTPIDLRKVSMGYQPAMQRPCCRNCESGEERRQDRMPPYDTVTRSCKRGAFGTTAMAVCGQYTPKVRQNTRAPK